MEAGELNEMGKTNYHKNFYENVNKIRTVEYGKSLEVFSQDLSVQTGIPSLTIKSYIETRSGKFKQPPIRNAALLAKALNVSLDSLCGLNDIEDFNSLRKPETTEEYLMHIHKIIQLATNSFFQLEFEDNEVRLSCRNEHIVKVMKELFDRPDENVKELIETYIKLHNKPNDNGHYSLEIDTGIKLDKKIDAKTRELYFEINGEEFPDNKFIFEREIAELRLKLLDAKRRKLAAKDRKLAARYRKQVYIYGDYLDDEGLPQDPPDIEVNKQDYDEDYRQRKAEWKRTKGNPEKYINDNYRKFYLD